jgi:hypothetical protein
MVKIPAGAYTQDMQQDSQRLIRTMAQCQGIGLIDYDPLSSLEAFGYSLEDRALRFIPGFATALAAGSGAALNIGCLDFSMHLTPQAASGAAAWAALGTLTVALSPQPGNVLILDTDPVSGVLRYEVHTWGRAVPTTVTVSGTTLTTGVGSTYSGTLDWTGSENQLRLGTSPGPFTGTTGLCALLPGADTFGATMRTFINAALSDTLAVMDDFLWNEPPSGTTPISQPCSATIGGMMFHPLDDDAAVDIIIPGAGVAGGEYRGKVVEYIGPNQVQISPAVSTPLTNAQVNLFLGRICVPKASTTIPAATDPGANPVVTVAAQAGRLQVTYQATSIWNIHGAQRAFYGNVERFGGRFYPSLAASATGPLSVVIDNLFVDDDVTAMPQATPWELHSTGSNFYQYGGGSSHTSSLLADRVAKRVLNAQDFAT